MKTLIRKNEGFTLVEMLVTLGVLILIISIGLTANFSFLKSDVLKTERSKVVGLLVKTRSLSMNNMYQSPHGFCYIHPNYIIFRDNPETRCVSGALTNQLIPANTNISDNTNTIFPNIIIFSQLAGTTTPSNIKLSNGIKSFDINVNNEGTIEW